MEHKLHEAAAAAVLVVHLAWLLWVILAALVTRGRQSLTVLHVLSLVWEALSKSVRGRAH
jgi:hypothetical protein